MQVGYDAVLSEYTQRWRYVFGVRWKNRKYELQKTSL